MSSSCSVANISDSRVPGIQLSGGSVVFKESQNGSLTVKLYIDGRKLFEKHTRKNDLTMRWEINPPMILQDGSRLAVKLTERKPYHLTREVRAEASATFGDCQRLISSCPQAGEFNELKLIHDPMTTISIFAQTPDTLQPILDDAVKVSEQTKAVLDRLGRAKQFLQTIMDLGTSGSELHPIAKAVFGCVNIVYETLKKQEQCNQLVLDLAKDMAATLCYVEDVEQFARLAQLKQAINDVRPLMEDATNFIVEVTGVGQGLLSMLSSETQDRIDELTKRFNRFKQQFDRGISVQSVGTLELLLKEMESTKDDKWLDELKPQGSSRGRPTAECMDGTREDIMASIDGWCDDLDASCNILWISGFPGVGKTAISRKLVTRLKSSRRLGSSFFFQRELAAMQTPINLWRTLAFDLSHNYPSIRSAIVTHLKDGGIDLENADAGELFRSLVEGPLKHNVDVPPGRLPVIVIDALDECGGLEGSRSKHRTVLLQGIKAWTRLAPQFKLVVTSRPEDDITRALSTSHHIELGSGENVSPSSSSDIRSFLRREFERVADKYPASLSSVWPGAETIEIFTKRSAGLFIYADTLIKFVDEGQPKEQLNSILSEPLHHDSLTQLYKQILCTSFKDPSPAVLEGFKNVTGTIILAKVPLGRQDVLHLLDMESITLEHICQGLRSVLGTGDLLRFTHQSFVDFLVDSRGCHPSFLFDYAIQMCTLLTGSLRVMKNELRFNICKLETSYLIHDDIPDLKIRVHDNISTHLQYACRFWTDHIHQCTYDFPIAMEVEWFLTNQFLYWLEVMSLLGKVNRVTQGLRSVIAWSKHNNDKIAIFMADAVKFVAAFAIPIAQSLPHIYLSSIVFAPKQSVTAETFHGKYMNVISVNTGRAVNWPAIQNVLYGHSRVVNSVAFSPDGCRLVSGSYDNTIRLWDAETGDAIGKPLDGHSNNVSSVAFSPDGSRVVSGSWDKTIRLWDAETGDAIGKPLQGHSEYVQCIAFSPDGSRLVSGSWDKTIRLWDADTGDAIGKPLEGHSHYVECIAFSPDGSRVVSGSWDKTIRLWDAETVHAIGKPLEGHSKHVECIAFSPDGYRVASGSFDKTVRLWGAKTGDAIGKPLEGHSEIVSSVAFSPDGSRVASGSWDKTIRLWDAETGDTIGKLLQGDYVECIAFSPDGSRLVSGSWDHTIRLWDAETVDAIGKPLEGHSKNITSVAFSPDGSYFVSGSWDKTIRLWDAETGDAIGKPLEGHFDYVECIAFSPDGCRMVSGSWNNSICLWDTETGNSISKLQVRDYSGASVTSVAFSPDGSRIVSGSSDYTIHLWNAETGDAIGEPLEGHFRPVTSVAFSPNGRRIVSSSSDETICLWDAGTGDAVGEPLEGHSDTVNSVAFSPDGSRIVSASSDKTICLWDAETGDDIGEPLEGHSSTVQSVAFSPDGSRIVSASSDKTIRLWDSATGDAIGKPLKGHSDIVNSVAFSPDGSCIVSASEDHTIRLWDSEISDIVSPSIYSQCLPSGWVVNSDAEKLFWVPPWNRAGLCYPKNTMTITRDGVSTVLDMSRFVHGTAWEKCRTG